MRLDEDGRQFALHRQLLDWVEVLEDHGEALLIHHPQRGVPIESPAHLYDREVSSIEEFLNRQVHVESPFDMAAFAVEPAALYEIDDQPAESLIETFTAPRVERVEFPLSPTERRLCDKGWTIIPFRA